MAVSTLTDNPFGRPRPSWRSSIIRALVIEVVLFAFLLLAFLSPGSHNPVPFFLALILQFPSSLLFVPLLRADLAFDGPIAAATTAVVVLAQVAFLSVMIRRPWR